MSKEVHERRIFIVNKDEVFVFISSILQNSTMEAELQ